MVTRDDEGCVMQLLYSGSSAGQDNGFILRQTVGSQVE